ncbi:hypothetical protein [Roseococcus sp. SYP-B2431]|uniref:hypothetical protein n=1 Tax=Roseococcus sp. SYP-B2431 TaxID=2496640 RepID=UPI0013F3D7E3|nr:hypothetical protein [Roseococcus sp. SYP-B2431]
MSASLEGKTAAELKAMVANAENILAGPNTKLHAKAAEFREAAKAALETRRVSPVGQKAPVDPVLEAALKRILAVAAEAQTRFDLTAETAKAAGVKQPHALLSKDGAPKTGGGVRTKKYRRCPYISHRGPAGIAMLQYAIPADGADGFWTGGLVAVGAPELDTPMEEEAAVAAFLQALAETAPARR